jgi:hypothetical protein
MTTPTTSEHEADGTGLPAMSVLAPHLERGGPLATADATAALAGPSKGEAHEVRLETPIG